LLTDATRWRRLVFDHPGILSIQLMNGTHEHHALRLDADTSTLSFPKPPDSSWRSELSYKEPEAGLLTLEGTFDGRSVRARLRRADELLLRSRGFRWVNEKPFNR